MNTSVGLPYNSAFIKFDILPKKIPTGAEAQIKSDIVKKEILLMQNYMEDPQIFLLV